MRRVGPRRWSLLLLLTVAACDHSEPFKLAGPEPLGPYSDASLRQLTFNRGDDRDPSGRGDLVVFSRLEPERSDQDRCLGFLPAQGGTLLRLVCAGGPWPDDRTDAWLNPIISPDETRLAYVRQAGPVGGLGPSERALVVAPLGAPAEPEIAMAGGFPLPDGRFADAARRLTWRDDQTLRALVGAELVVTLPGAVRDTVFTPFTLVDLDVASGTFEPAPGVTAAAVYANAPDGGVWFVREDERSLAESVLRHASPDGGPVTVLDTLPGEVVDLTNLEGQPVVVLRLISSAELLTVESGVHIVDLEAGRVERVGSVVDVRRIWAMPGTRHLLLERRSQLGLPWSDLWLLELP
ncbi:MAG: hypothetical protein GTN62_06925 [Gemmatimonadales bacterium]|nr:hypothetical protein [Gemmatimonadales bacterium]NIN11232.1 hypothetical protein [Gemmatimonadales bacterium]NIN49831.1 hypothetical protein [Gemmatimonadales bacterium]NIP07295.1 hypothetical protein [Gemmatimonadales bacterium]NIR02990.1 hypothetical protein [Gemmatimonadales bacterium]